MSLRARIALLTGLVAFLGLALGLFLSSLLLSRLALLEVDRTLRLQARTLLQEALATLDRQVPPEEEADLLFGDFPAAAWIYEGGRLVWQGGLPSAPSLLKGLVHERPVSLAGWRALALERGGSGWWWPSPWAWWSGSPSSTCAWASPSSSWWGFCPGPWPTSSSARSSSP